jgi:prenyltransferase beta subunit
MVGNASYLDMPNPQIGRVLTEMRTGYSRLNKYRNNIGQSPTLLCDCGEEEPLNTTYCTAIFTIMRVTLAVQLKTIDESLDLLYLLTRDSNKEKHQKKLTFLEEFIKSTGHFPELATPILSLSNTIYQYKEKIQ